MSEAVTALGSVSFDGIARVEALPLRGMITLRGDLGSAPVKKAATEVAGVDMPGQREAKLAGERGILWMSPDELLVLTPHDRVKADVEAMRATLGDAFALAVNVSDARAMFAVRGPRAREVLGKLAPVDLSPGAFGPGELRRTRIAQIAAAFWMVDDETFHLVCFRSVARYAFDLLKVAAQPGSEVGFYLGE